MVISQIETIITALKSPLHQDEREAGWTEYTKQSYVPFFTNLLKDVREGNPTPYIGTVRSLDAHGIGEGKLYEEIISVTNAINSMSR